MFRYFCLLLVLTKTVFCLENDNHFDQINDDPTVRVQDNSILSVRNVVSGSTPDVQHQDNSTNSTSAQDDPASHSPALIPGSDCKYFCIKSRIFHFFFSSLTGILGAVLHSILNLRSTGDIVFASLVLIALLFCIRKYRVKEENNYSNTSSHYPHPSSNQDIQFPLRPTLEGNNRPVVSEV